MAEPEADTGTSDPLVETSRAGASTVVCGGVKDKLKRFERMRRDSVVERADSAALIGPRGLGASNAASLRVSEKKVRELESALRHREELIRSLEGTIAQRESDLSFVLKEKFQLSKTIVASRSAGQPCNATTPPGVRPPGVQRSSSADSTAKNVGDSSHTLSTSPRSHSHRDKCCEETLCEEAVQSGVDAKIVPEQICEAMRKLGFEEGPHSRTHKGTEVVASGAKEHDVSSLRGTHLRALHDAKSASRQVEVDGKFSKEKHVAPLTPIACHTQWDDKSEDARGNSRFSLEDNLGSAGSITLLAGTPTKRALGGRTRASLEDASAYLNNNRWRLKADKFDEAAPPVQLVSPEGKQSVGKDFPSAATGVLRAGESAGELEEEVSKLTLASPRETKAVNPANTSNSLRVQTQARIDAEAETSDVLAMHEELCSKIDCLQNAFEEVPTALYTHLLQ
ncbi:hypothetical protein ACSSS7_002330 [Eimeria intestinalis]